MAHSASFLPTGFATTLNAASPGINIDMKFANLSLGEANLCSSGSTDKPGTYSDKPRVILLRGDLTPYHGSVSVRLGLDESITSQSPELSGIPGSITSQSPES